MTKGHNPPAAPPSGAMNVRRQPLHGPDRQSADAPSVRDVDVIYRESDRLYYGVARDCGLSIASFWALVTIVINGGSTTQAAIASEYYYSRQTVNSAVKNLEAKGLVRIAFEEGDRRSKKVSLTPEGEAFCAGHIRPAIDAEERAFETLSVDERREFVRLVRAYTDAMDDELGALTERPGAAAEEGDLTDGGGTGATQSGADIGVSAGSSLSRKGE